MTETIEKTEIVPFTDLEMFDAAKKLRTKNLAVLRQVTNIARLQKFLNVLNVEVNDLKRAFLLRCPDAAQRQIDAIGKGQTLDLGVADVSYRMTPETFSITDEPKIVNFALIHKREALGVMIKFADLDENGQQALADLCSTYIQKCKFTISLDLLKPLKDKIKKWIVINGPRKSWSVKVK
jgi:hypothetical protein